MTEPLRDRLQESLGTAYTLERELGGGGMSRVFAAEETRFHRRVVIKLLSPELAQGVSAERFEREIGLAAALQHPNVVPVHAAGDAGGLPWYSMPYVEGESLRERVARGPIAADEAVSILRDVGRALAYAHDRGIVHRDVKPENILLTSGAAVVTDFGIAKALSASKTQAPGGTLTQIGTSLGTPAYMAPEQASGDPATDHRADLYALGCVAYEMLTGAAPFAGRPPHQLFTAHLSEVPAPLPATVPRPLAALVQRCLEKDPARRPQRALEVLDALGTSTTGASAAAPSGRRSLWPAVAVLAVAAALVAAVVATRRGAPERGQAMSAVAVLPFENASGDTASNYFADGMTDELATALAKVPSLQVASRTSSYAFRKRDGIDARTIASKLGVGAIVEGSVRRAGSQLRVTAQLTRGSDGRSLWADAFTDDAGDVFAVQSRLTRAIVAAITPTLVGRAPNDSSVVVAGPATKDAAAYDAYLRARYELNRRGDGVRQSIPLFRAALARDPRFADAWAGLSSAWALRADYDGSVDPLVALDSARAAHARAVALDSTRWEPWSALGYASVIAGRFADAERALRRGVALGPRETVAHRWLGMLYDRTGRYEEEERSMRTSVSLDPLSGMSTSNLAGVVALYPSRRAEARTLALRAVALDPTNGGVASNSALTLYQTGYLSDAAATIRSAPAISADNPNLLAVRIAVAGALGQTDSVRRAMTMLERLPPTPQRLEIIANARAILGDWDGAFASAARGIAMRPGLEMIALYGRIWGSHARDPRMRALCAKTVWDCDAFIALLERSAPGGGR